MFEVFFIAIETAFEVFFIAIETAFDMFFAIMEKIMKGFTLIEMLIVLLVITILFGIVGPKLISIKNESNTVVIEKYEDNPNTHFQGKY